LNIWADLLCPPQTALLSYGYDLDIEKVLRIWDFLDKEKKNNNNAEYVFGISFSLSHK